MYSESVSSLESLAKRFPVVESITQQPDNGCQVINQNISVVPLCDVKIERKLTKNTDPQGIGRKIPQRMPMNGRVRKFEYE